MKTYAIILASGAGSRFGSEIPKQFLKINNKMILEHSLEAFEFNVAIDEIILVTNKQYIDKCSKIIKVNNYKKVQNIVAGGKERNDSVFNALEQINDKNAKILIHDAARPLVSQRIINTCIEKLKTYKAINVVLDCTDTLITTKNNTFCDKTLNRNNIKRVQTPQAFELNTIKKAHELLKSSTLSINVTDDCGLVNYFNLAEVFLVKGDENNIKITYPIDLIIAQNILKAQS